MQVVNSTDNKTHAMHTRKHNMRGSACPTLNRLVRSNMQLHTVAVESCKLARVALEINILYRMDAITNVANTLI